MSRLRPAFLVPLLLALVLAALAAGIFGIAACGTSGTSDTLAPITGIVIRAETLTTGRGCGTGATQVFKYVAVVFGVNPDDANVQPNAQRRDQVIAANVYDCFTDGLFVDLPPSGNSTDYDVQLYVYNEPAFTGAGGADILGGIVTRLQFNRAKILFNDGGAEEKAAIDLDLSRLRASRPTYTTTCTVQEFELVQANAVCRPFSAGAGAIDGGPEAAGGATIMLSAGSFKLADAGKLTCDSDYLTVRYRASTSTVVGDVTDVRCSTLTAKGSEAVAISIPAPQAPASYMIDIALLKGDGTAVGQTTCGAETSPGVASPAVCKPIQ